MFFGGVDWDTKCQTFWQWVVNGCALPDASVVWSQQDAPRPAAPAVMLRISNIAESGQSWIDTEDNPLTFTPKTITAISTIASTLTIPAHGFNNGDGPVQVVATTTQPGNLPASTDFWVTVVDVNTIQLAGTFAATGGVMPAGAGNPQTPITITSVGSGTITVVATGDTRPAGAELLEVARTYMKVSLELHCHAAPGVGLNMATSILQRIRTRRMWSSQLALLESQNIALIEVERIRAVAGIRDALLFEPRAYLDIHFCVVAEEADDLTYIESADLLDQINNRTIHIGN